MRGGEGPALLECMTYRWLAHVGPTEDLDVGFRKKQDVEYWRKRCPIESTRSSLLEREAITELEYERLIEMEQDNVEKSLIFASESSYPLPEELYEGLYG